MVCLIKSGDFLPIKMAFTKEQYVCAYVRKLVKLYFLLFHIKTRDSRQNFGKFYRMLWERNSSLVPHITRCPMDSEKTIHILGDVFKSLYARS